MTSKPIWKKNSGKTTSENTNEAGLVRHPRSDVSGADTGTERLAVFPTGTQLARIRAAAQTQAPAHCVAVLLYRQ